MPAVNDRPVRFPRRYRIRRQAEFDRVFAQQVYAADRTLVVQGCRNDLDLTRLGLSVSRRVGHAVVRNRWKRVIREAFRHQRASFPRGLDLIVRPRRGAVLGSEQVRHSLSALVRRIGRRLRDSSC
jgi:ribonuclease P protein component